jgi:predicted dehydrogenase
MRIGLIGAGAVAQLHRRAAGLLPGVEMTAVCDLREGLAAEVAEPIGARVFTDYRAMFASGVLDAVIINTPHALHRPMVLDAAAAGLHVLVEKPMATTVEDCDLMTAAAERAGVVLGVGHIQHFLPDKAAVAAALARGAIGDVRMIHDVRTTDYRPGSRPGWFLDKAIAGGGAVMNIGAHCLDRVTWLGGAPASEISARTLNRFGVAVETDATIAVRLANDVFASVTVTSDAPRRADQVTVVGDQGTLVASPATGALLRRDGQTEVLHRPSDSDIPDAFQRQLADFVASVSGAAPAVTQLQGRRVVGLVLASYASSEQHGYPIELSPTGDVLAERAKIAAPA